MAQQGGEQPIVAADPEEGANEERKSLLRKQQAAQAASTPLRSAWKVWTLLAITGLGSLLVLVALFSGGSTEPYMAPMKVDRRDTKPPWYSSADKPMTAEELKLSTPDDPCPEELWIPKECQTSERLRSMSLFDYCNMVFEEGGWPMDLLVDCGLVESGRMFDYGNEDYN